MKVEPLGDAAYILRELDAPAYELANSLNADKPVGLLEAVASYDTVGLYVTDSFDPSTLLDRRTLAQSETKIHYIPVCYEMGEDLADSARFLGLEVEQLIELHMSVEYRCYAIGFCPGFPYLGYLPDRIARLPRRPSPRTRVEPGSVGITGRQTGIYPLPRPGGWALIGRTPLTLVDVEDEHFPLAAGDLVHFHRINDAEFARLEGERL